MKASPYRPVEYSSLPMDHRHIRTISISKLRELRVGIATTDTSGSVSIQKFEKDRDHPSCEFLPAGRQFYIFHAQLRLLIKALGLAADALDEHLCHTTSEVEQRLFLSAPQGSP